MAQTAFLRKGTEEKKAPVGFSWTTFCWGFWPALLRRDWKWAGYMFLVSLGLNLFAKLLTNDLDHASAMSPELGGLVMLYFALSIGTAVYFGWIYNKKYTQRLLDQGFEPADDYSAELLKNYGFVVKNTPAPTIENNFFQP